MATPDWFRGKDYVRNHGNIFVENIHVESSHNYVYLELVIFISYGNKKYYC